MTAAARSRRALLRETALQTALLVVIAVPPLCAPAVAQPAPNARPTGGMVVGGQASISQSATNTAITQTTQRAAINWNSFDVGAKQSVTIAQPSSNAIT